LARAGRERLAGAHGSLNSWRAGETVPGSRSPRRLLPPGARAADELVVKLGGAIQLAAAGDAPELLLSDGLVEDQLTNNPEVVRRASSTFNNVRADALNRAGSRGILTEAMDRWSK